MRILVTGGAGYIGSFTTRRLMAEGHHVAVYDNLCFGHRESIPANVLHVGDLKDIAHLDHLFVSNRIEAVVHFAAFAAVGESVIHPSRYYQNNLINSVQLLDCARRHGVKRFVFSSTCATYGLPQRVPIDDLHPQNPVNPYGATKLAFEGMLRDYAHAYGMTNVALRYFNAAGASPDGQYGEDHTPESHLIPLVLQVALGQRSHIEIFGTDYPTPDGTCIRDYIHVDDLAQAHMLALNKAPAGQFSAYNIGTGTGNSVREVIDLARKITGKPIAIRESGRREGDPPALVASAEKIAGELGWKPDYPKLDRIMESAWTWHKSHPKGYRS